MEPKRGGKSGPGSQQEAEKDRRLDVGGADTQPLTPPVSE